VKGEEGSGREGYECQGEDRLGQGLQEAEWTISERKREEGGGGVTIREEEEGEGLRGGSRAVDESRGALR
jgi:hypothetical protein